MLILTLLMVGVLLGITVQDLLWRAVYLWVFPLLFVLFVMAWFLERRDLPDAFLGSLINTGFLLLQFLLVSLYFFVKNKRPVKLTSGLLGWGDLLFLLCSAFYFSTLNFIFFYVSSLLLTLLGWLIWQMIAKSPDRRIPLAGIQSVFMVALLVADKFGTGIDLSNDSWLTIRLLKLA
jgi:phosphoglycerol transferase MdoB-like AlkP superfamily enzyme